MYTILVADDERWIRKGIVRMIDCEKNRIGEIYEAVSVQQALELYEEKKPDIVLTDISFPDKSGLDLVEYIDRDNSGVRVVLISAYSDFEYVQQALCFHASNYLLKPVSKEKLNQAIRACVEELGAREETNKAEKMKEDMKSSDMIVNRLIEELDRDCSRKFSLPQLAETYHISEAYLSHVFKKQTGISLTNYIAQIRIEKACQLIAMDNQKSGKFYRIASRVGYDDYPYFVRVFKKVTGISPREFQRKLMQESGEHGGTDESTC